MVAQSSPKKLSLIDVVTAESREFLLSHGGLAATANREPADKINSHYFTEDFAVGRLSGLDGTFVAYQKGIFCGQSLDQTILYNQARGYYGGSSLAVFRVPQGIETVDDSLKTIFGVY